MMEEVEDVELVVARIAALDLGKAGLEACVRVPKPPPGARADAGAARLWHHHGTAVGDGGVVAAVGRAAGGDGIHQHLLGWKGYTTNLVGQPADFVIGAYHQLWRIEEAFRMSRHDLQASPIYHRTRAPIEAHLSVVFAAMAVSHRIETARSPSVTEFGLPRGRRCFAACTLGTTSPSVQTRLWGKTSRKERQSLRRSDFNIPFTCREVGEQFGLRLERGSNDAKFEGRRE